MADDQGTIAAREEPGAITQPETETAALDAGVELQDLGDAGLEMN